MNPAFLSEVTLKIFKQITSLFISFVFILIQPLFPSLHSPLPNQTKPIASPTTTPTPSPSPNSATTLSRPYPTQTPISNYQVAPDPDGEEGLYVMSQSPSEPMSTVDELNQAVNTYRQTHNLTQLYIDPNLCDLASLRALEVDSSFSHQGFSEHIKAGDFDYTGFNTIGENLWQGSFSGVHIVEFGWDKTTGHRANLQGNWTRGCAGIFQTNAVFIFAN